MEDDAPRAKEPGFRIGSVYKIPIYLSSTWIILAVLITVIYADVVAALMPTSNIFVVYLVSFCFVVTLCGSVFLHELGHALVSLKYRIPVRRITLEMLGGHTQMEAEAPTPKSEAAIALAGPAVSALLGVLGVVGLVFFDVNTLLGQFAFQIAACNLIVAVYNVLPGLPLDGGRALRALVWAIKGDRHIATTVAGWAGRVVSAVTIAGGVWLFSVNWLTLLGLVFALMVGAVLWFGASRAIQIGTLGAQFEHLDAESLMRPVVHVLGDVPLSEALRRMTEMDAAGVLVVDSKDVPVSLMHGAAVSAVPVARRPWIPVSDVCRTLDKRNSWDISLRGEDIIQAMRENPSTEYAVLSGPFVRGVVRVSDIADAVDRRKPTSNVS